MAVKLSSKTFFVPKSAYMPLDQIKEWFDGIDRKAGDCRLTVTLELLGEERQKKVTAKAELLRLAVDAALENKETWINGEYKFFFAAQKYVWKGRDIYLTASEALFLFRWLVLNDEICGTQLYYLRHMRRRLGQDFLREVMP